MSHLHGAGPSTRAVHVGSPDPVAGRPVVNPIILSTTYFSEPEGAGEVVYGRYGNGPNIRALEARLAALEGAEDSLVVGSGMAALVSALLAFVATGDHIVSTESLYGGTRTLLDHELSRLGIGTTYVDFLTPGWEAALRPETRVVLAEFPSNPTLRMVDPRPIAEAARANGAVSLVDATFASPINFRPLEHGVDLVMHSATKYLGGHSDVTAGVVSGRRELLVPVRERARTWGPMLDGHAAWLLERGLKTLALRMERHNRNGLEVARWCEGHPGIARVFYPGLASHPDHEIATRVLNGFGGIMGIELREGGAATSRFIAALRLARVAPSLGGVETLVSEPRYTSQAGLTPDQRAAVGIPDGFVRFSLGVEDAADIITDIEQALGAVDGV